MRFRNEFRMTAKSKRVRNDDAAAKLKTFNIFLMRFRNEFGMTAKAKQIRNDGKLKAICNNKVSLANNKNMAYNLSSKKYEMKVNFMIKLL